MQIELLLLLVLLLARVWTGASTEAEAPRADPHTTDTAPELRDVPDDVIISYCDMIAAIILPLLSFTFSFFFLVWL